MTVLRIAVCIDFWFHWLLPFGFIAQWTSLGVCFEVRIGRQRIGRWFLRTGCELSARGVLLSFSGHHFVKRLVVRRCEQAVNERLHVSIRRRLFLCISYVTVKLLDRNIQSSQVRFQCRLCVKINIIM